MGFAIGLGRGKVTVDEVTDNQAPSENRTKVRVSLGYDGAQCHSRSSAYKVVGLRKFTLLISMLVSIISYDNGPGKENVNERISLYWEAPGLEGVQRYHPAYWDWVA